MWVRRAVFWWLVPSAFVLPLWLLVGWAVFQAGGWAFVFLLVAMPAVFFGQLVLTLLVRARGTVRAQRAVSWWDVLGFGLWHVLTIAVGFYDPAWFWPVLVSAIVVGLGLFWLSLWQLWREAKPTRVVLQSESGFAYIPPEPSPTRTTYASDDVIVIAERPTPPAS